MKVAIYARVSTTDQNPEAQLVQLREYAERRNFTISQEYVDQITGAAEKRKGKDTAYQQLLDDAHRLTFNCVLVWKFDRFARSLTALLNALNTFSALGIDFVSVTQQIDTTTPAGRLFFSMVGAFAEFERELIAERTRIGIANARRKGVTLGRPRDPQLELLVIRMKAEGLRICDIARRVKRSPAGVLKILDRSKT